MVHFLIYRVTFAFIVRVYSFVCPNLIAPGTHKVAHFYSVFSALKYFLCLFHYATFEQATVAIEHECEQCTCCIKQLDCY